MEGWSDVMDSVNETVVAIVHFDLGVLKSLGDIYPLNIC